MCKEDCLTASSGRAVLLYPPRSERGIKGVKSLCRRRLCLPREGVPARHPLSGHAPGRRAVPPSSAQRTREASTRHDASLPLARPCGLRILARSTCYPVLVLTARKSLTGQATASGGLRRQCLTCAQLRGKKSRESEETHASRRSTKIRECEAYKWKQMEF